MPFPVSLARALRGWDSGAAIVAIATIIASTAFGNSSALASTPLAVFAVARYVSGVELVPLGFLSSILLSVIADVGGAVVVYLVGLLAYMILEYTYMRTPRELYSYKLASVLRAASVVSIFYPAALYSRLFTGSSPGYDPFSLGAIVLSALMLLIYIVVGGSDIAAISNALAIAFDRSHTAIISLARILSIAVCVAGTIIYRDPILLAIPFAGISIESSVTRLARIRGSGGTASQALAPIIYTITPMTALTYMILAGL